MGRARASPERRRFVGSPASDPSPPTCLEASRRPETVVYVWLPRHPDGYLASKCATGNDPCTSAAKSGFRTPISLDDGTVGAICDAQCHFGAGVERDDCATRPTAAVDSAADNVLDDLRAKLDSINWEAWLIPLIWLACCCMVLSIVNRILCPKTQTAFTIAYGLCFVVASLACGGIGAAYLLHTKREVYDAYVGEATIIGGGIAASAVLLFTVVMTLALATDASRVLRCGYWLVLVLTTLEVVSSLIVCYWIYSLGAIPSDALTALFGDARAHIDGFLAEIFDKPVAVAEGLVCKTYQLCCRDPALDDGPRGLTGADRTDGVDSVADAASGDPNAASESASGTYIANPYNSTHCLAPAQHQGATTDLELTLRDPSTENFCPYTSGAEPRLLTTPPIGTCAVLEGLTSDADFNQARCQANFCTSGTDGYLDFVSMFVSLLQRYALPLGVVLVLLVVLQLILACNLKQAARLSKREKQLRKAQAEVDIYVDRPMYTESV